MTKTRPRHEQDDARSSGNDRQASPKKQENDKKPEKKKFTYQEFKAMKMKEQELANKRSEKSTDDKM